MKYDLISIGDSVIDAFSFINEAEVKCTLNKNECKLCVNYADKIPVEKFALCPAGNASNNAVGASRLGLKTAIYSEIGNDSFGKIVVDNFRNNNVALDFINLNKNASTNLHTVISYQGERTIFVHHAKRDYKLPEFSESPNWIYYTSLSQGFEKFQAELVSYVKKNPEIKVGFNPATYQLKSGLANLRNILEVTSAIFMNLEESKRLLNISEKEQTEIKTLHKKVFELGPKITVITDGSNGSTVFDGEKFYSLGLYDTPIVDRTGVGDSFATGFIAALFYGMDIPTALKWGTINASGVIQKIGAQEGLMTKKEIESVLATNPKFTEI